jgi:colicin import membrane protein
MLKNLKSIETIYSLKRFTPKSLILHGVLIALFFIWSFVQSGELAKRKEANLRLIQQSVRVELVSMPKMSLQELKALENLSIDSGEKIETTKNELKKSPETGNELLKAKKNLSLTDMLKKYKKKDLPKSKKSAPGKKKNNSNSKMRGELKKLLFAGNKISKGSGITGGKVTVDEMALGAYTSQLPSMIRPYWKLPSFLMNKGLTCRVRIYLGANGKLIKAEIYQSSGVTEYDQRALASIKQASPFPALNEKILGVGTRGEILLGFPL